MQTKKIEFINYLSTVYGGFLDDKKRKLWIKDCIEVLEDEIDYLKFRIHFLHEFDTKTLNNIPSPQWLYKESRQFLPNRRSAIEQTEKMIAEQKQLKGVPCPEYIRLKMKALFADKTVENI